MKSCEMKPQIDIRRKDKQWKSSVGSPTKAQCTELIGSLVFSLQSF